MENGIEIRGNRIHFLGIKDYKHEERRISEKRIQRGRDRGKYESLSEVEVKDLKKLTTKRRTLENIRESQINKINAYYTDGGSYMVEDTGIDGKPLTINQKIESLDNERNGENGKKGMAETLKEEKTKILKELDKPIEQLREWEELRVRKKKGELTDPNDIKDLENLENLSHLKDLIILRNDVDKDDNKAAVSEEDRKNKINKYDEKRKETLNGLIEDRNKLQRLESLRAKNNDGELEDQKEQDELELLQKDSRFEKIVTLLEDIEKIDKEHEDYEDYQQAMILAGGIYRFSFRGAKNDIKYKTGDFFAGRALNLTDRVVGRYKFAAGILDPVKGKYEGEEFDYGGQDFWENLCKDKAKLSEEQVIQERIKKIEDQISDPDIESKKLVGLKKELENLEDGLNDPIEKEINSIRDNLNNTDLKKNDEKELRDKLEDLILRRGDAVRKVLNARMNDGARLEKLYKIRVEEGGQLNLEDAEIENEQLWDDFINRYGVVENWYMADEVDMYIKIDEFSRSPLWQAGSFFQDPN